MSQVNGDFRPPSPQELLILCGVWDGLSNKAVADRMGLSDKTVKNYLQSLYNKFEANGRVQMVRKALELGILTVKAPSTRRCDEMEVPG